jgi:hypothetical protein
VRKAEFRHSAEGTSVMLDARKTQERSALVPAERSTLRICLLSWRSAC